MTGIFRPELQAPPLSSVIASASSQKCSDSVKYKSLTNSYIQKLRAAIREHAVFVSLESLEFHSEVTHEFSLPNDLHSASDFVTTVVNVLESSCDHVHVVVCINKEEMATHSGILVRKIPWTEEAGGLHSVGSQRVGHN